MTREQILLQLDELLEACADYYYVLGEDTPVEVEKQLYEEMKDKFKHTLEGIMP